VSLGSTQSVPFDVLVEKLHHWYKTCRLFFISGPVILLANKSDLFHFSAC